MYPDQSLYPANSVPDGRPPDQQRPAPRRPDRPRVEGDDRADWFAPIVADAEAGFGGALNGFELTKAMIEAGAAGVHFEDQLASEKKCGHMGGKVLVPTAQRIRNLRRGPAGRRRRAACRPSWWRGPTPTRRDLITSDVDERDARVHHRRAHRRGLLPDQRRASTQAIARGAGLRAVRRPDLVRDLRRPTYDQARRFAEAVHDQFPDKRLAYNCSPSLQLEVQALRRRDRVASRRSWRNGLRVPVRHAGRLPQPQPGDVRARRRLRRRRAWRRTSALQQHEFATEDRGYTATQHQRQVGTGYFDDVAEVITGGAVSTGALEGSTESAQF